MDSRGTEQIFKVEIQADAAIKTLADYNNAIEQTTAEMDELKRANQQGSEEFAKLSQVLATQKRERRELQKVIQNDVKLQREEETSLKGMRAALSNLTKQYDELSAAERDGAKGDELRGHINRITTELKAAEEETQRYYRNVGNYEQSVKAALRETQQELVGLKLAYSQLSDEEKASANGREMEQKIQGLTEKAGKMRDAMDDAKRSISNAASDTRAFNTLNEFAQLTAASYGLMNTAAIAFGASQKNAEEITKRMAVVMQTLNSLQTIQNLLQKESNVMTAIRNIQVAAAAKAEAAAAVATNAHGAALVSATAKQAAYNLVANANPYVLLVTGITAVIGALSLLGDETDNVTEKTRTATERNDEFAQSVGNAAGKDIAAANIMYSAAIRAAAGSDARRDAIKALQKAYPSYFGDLNAENASVKDLTTRYNQLTQAILANAMVHGAQEQLQKESDRLAELNVKYSRLVSERNKINRVTGPSLFGGWFGGDRKESGSDAYTRITNELNDLDSQITQQRAVVQSALDFYMETQREAQNVGKELRKDQEQAAAAAASGGGGRGGHGGRGGRGGGGRGGNGGGTPKKTPEEEAAEKAASAAAKRLETLRKELLNSYARLKSQMTEEDSENVENISKYFGLQLAALKSHFAEMGELTDEEQNAYDALYNNIIKRRDEAINKFYEDADKKEQELKDKMQAQSEELLQMQIDNAAENSPEKMAAELQLLTSQYEVKLQLHKDNEEMQTAITAEYERKRHEIEKTYADAARQLFIEKAQSIAGAMGAASQLIDQFSKKSKGAAIAAKSLAVGEIAINQGVAIAAGIKQAQSVPFPANIAAIASVIGAILTGITQAMRAVNSAKFATGGFVSGPGSATSDSIPARLSNGESVINANSTALFTGLLSALNQIGGGVPIQAGETAANVAGEAILSRAFARGAAALPAPVVSVVEIQQASDRVAKINERATL